MLTAHDPAVAILSLKICDPAMGSGHFLVSLVTAGAVTEFPIAGGDGPFGITTGTDGALWFTETYTNANLIGRACAPHSS